MEYNYTRGRPFGGQGWLINSSFVLKEFNFINKQISYIHVGIGTNDIVLIGVYLPFNDNTNESKSTYEISLSIIYTLCKKFELNNVPCMIFGDFNADINRKNKFDLLLNEFIRENKLIILENLFA